MRIVIESDEKAVITPAPAQTGPVQVEAINAGPPAPSLFQSATAGATTFAQTGSVREGIDAGGPPDSLVQALQAAASPTPNIAGENGDAGAAPPRA